METLVNIEVETTHVGISLEEVIEKMDRQISTAIRHYPILTSEVDDIKNDIYLRLIRSRYLDRYNPEKATLSTYVYGFVNNYCKKVLNHERTRAGQALANAFSIEESSENGSDRRGGILFLDLFDLKMEDWAERKKFIERLMEHLDSDERYCGYHSSGPSGIPRSVKEIVSLMLKGFSISEISSQDLMDTSTTFIRKKLKELQEISWLREYINVF